MPRDGNKCAALQRPTNYAVVGRKGAIELSSECWRSFRFVHSASVPPVKNLWRGQWAAAANSEQRPDDRDRRLKAVGRTVAAFESIARPADEFHETHQVGRHGWQRFTLGIAPNPHFPTIIRCPWSTRIVRTILSPRSRRQWSDEFIVAFHHFSDSSVMPSSLSRLPQHAAHFGNAPLSPVHN